MKKIYLIAVIFLFGIHSILLMANSIEKDTSKFGIGYSQFLSVGENIYSKDHNSFKGIYLEAGVDVFREVQINMRYTFIGAEIIDKHYVNSSKTKFNNLGVQIKYKYSPVKDLYCDPFVGFEIIGGKNQGKFVGYGFGLGGNLEYYFFRKIFLDLSAEYDIMRFNISAANDIEKLFDRTGGFQINLGLGFGF